MNAEQPLRKLPVDLGEIDEIASTHSDEWENPILGFLDTQTGEVHTVLRAALSQVEEGEPGEDEDDPPADVDADEWAPAIAIAKDSAGRYERIDAWESREEFQLMEEFAEATQTTRLREELSRALDGRGSFRRFKDVLADWPEAREAWFAFRDEAHRQRIRRWLNALGIDPIDTSQPPKPVPERW